MGGVSHRALSQTGAKDPILEANRNYWISLSSFVSGDFVPDSRRVIAGMGLTGGGPLSADVTLAAKLTDSVSLADSTTAASAAAVKAAYDAAQSKLPLSGGTVTGSLSIKNMLDLIGTAPATEQELGLYLLDKNNNIMGGHDFVHSVGNLKITQMYARNSNGLLSTLGVYASEDGTRYTLSSHNIILTGDVEIGHALRMSAGRGLLLASVRPLQTLSWSRRSRSWGCQAHGPARRFGWLPGPLLNRPHGLPVRSCFQSYGPTCNLRLFAFRSLALRRLHRVHFV